MLWGPGPRVRSPSCWGPGDSCPEELGSAAPWGIPAAPLGALLSDSLDWCCVGGDTSLVKYHDTLWFHVRSWGGKIVNTQKLFSFCVWRTWKVVGVHLRGTFLQTTPTAASQQSGACSAFLCACPPAQGPWGWHSWPALLGWPESQHPSRVFTVLGGGRLLGTWHSERSGRVDVLFFGAGIQLEKSGWKQMYLASAVLYSAVLYLFKLYFPNGSWQLTSEVCLCFLKSCESGETCFSRHSLHTDTQRWPSLWILQNPARAFSLTFVHSCVHFSA